MERKFSKRRTINKLVITINLIAAFCLFISQVCCYISPATFWPAELIAISYPIWLLINLAFVFYWLLQMHRFAFISFVIILASYRQLNLAYQLKFHSADKTKESSAAFTVMSYNVRLFDLYNWTGNGKTRAKIYEYLKLENPDILCFQEYFTSDNPTYKFENNNNLSKTLKAKNYHVEYSSTMRKTEHWGLATFTRFPIVHKGRILFHQARSNFGIYTDILIKNDTVRIYNVHLQSNHFKEEDYRFIEAPDSGSNEQIINSSKNVLKLLKRAAVKRAAQVDSLKSEIEKSPYPVILCGDFNDPPFSYAYTQLTEKLNDTFLEEGAGAGITLVGTVPIYRIDYILHDPVLKCHDFEVLPTKLSDHHPVKAIFKVMNN